MKAPWGTTIINERRAWSKTCDPALRCSIMQAHFHFQSASVVCCRLRRVLDASNINITVAVNRVIQVCLPLTSACTALYAVHDR